MEKIVLQANRREIVSKLGVKQLRHRTLAGSALWQEF
jgi:hypothetical protein